MVINQLLSGMILQVHLTILPAVESGGSLCLRALGPPGPPGPVARPAQLPVPPPVPSSIYTNPPEMHRGFENPSWMEFFHGNPI